MKKILFLAFCVLLSASVITIPYAPADADAYKSRFPFTTGATGGTLTLSITNPSTGVTNTDFTYVIYESTWTTPQYTSPTLTLPAGGSLTDSGFTTATATTTYGLEITFTGAFYQLVVLQLNLTDVDGAPLMNEVDVLRNAYTARVIYVHTASTPIVVNI